MMSDMDSVANIFGFQPVTRARMIQRRGLDLSRFKAPLRNYNYHHPAYE
jgi:hypothetical protein